MTRVPRQVFHLIEPESWARSQAEGRVVPPSLPTEGFVHCSTAGQIVGTIGRHFAYAEELVLLALDAASLATELRWEPGPTGEAYPHLYRAIELGEIQAVVPWHREPDGTVVLPERLRVSEERTAPPPTTPPR